ncbi:glycoside hydrolase domain-containing protein [Aquisphaera insulae]|uniref:glycoside hydrolase domain-containing protein n=1 Tax=Aquisphaera insulae TaxID=2712864 RepID=UPI0013ED53F8|nr:glycoside hydrolase domain-containing protein [Aquisphaera insulae]
METTRDAWVSQVGSEADGNNGASPRLKLKSYQEMSLLDVDTAPLRGRVIEAATLHVRQVGESPLLRITVGGVGAEWYEGTGTSYSTDPGGATFRCRRHPDLPWSIGGGDLCHVILGNGGTNWGNADATSPDASGWQSIAVRPAVVAARVAGLSHGFLLFDDTGSEFSHEGGRFKLRLFPNRFAFSKDQNRASAPYLMVRLGEEDRRPPSPPTGLESLPFEGLPGEAIVSWITPKDEGPAGTLGFVATLDGKVLPRELIPLAGVAGGRVEMHLRDLGLEAGKSVTLAISAVDAAGNVGPAARVTARLASEHPVDLPFRGPAVAGGRRAPPDPRAGLPRLGAAEVAVIDELVKVHPETRRMIPPQPADVLLNSPIWDAASRTIRLEAARNELVAFQVLVRGESPIPSESLKIGLKMTDGQEGRGRAVEATFGRYHLVPTADGPLPDPIVPLGPDSDRTPAEPAGRFLARSLHAELYVPHEATAGTHRGTLTIELGRDRLALAVELRVWDFSLPDHLSFLPEMNSYGLAKDEIDYYRLAHRHRTVLNRLPYNQRGEIADGCAPTLVGDGPDGRLDWTAWDRRFGPLLDGSAFADLPRKGVPVECFYLPIHENWPTPMEGNYRDGYWADRAFPESYRRALVRSSRQFAEHFRDRGWDDTLFQGFLNNKNNFKEPGWSRGSSPWLLDEPANFQDFWALRYFARAFHEGINQARAREGKGEGAKIPHAGMRGFPRMVFRADISRPQWRRDVLDGLLDDMVVSSAMREYPRLVLDRKRRLGEIVLEYGSTNPITASNWQPVSWSLDAWTLGADGVVPWQTIGTAGSWRQADELALFYPRESARGRGAGVVPSVRLKAYRRGQQDVEYLTLWARRQGLPRQAVAVAARRALKLAGTRRATEAGGVEDAGRIDAAGFDPDALRALRSGIGEALSRAHPAPEARLIDFRTPPREP